MRPQQSVEAPRVRPTATFIEIPREVISQPAIGKLSHRTLRQNPRSYLHPLAIAPRLDLAPRHAHRTIAQIERLVFRAGPIAPADCLGQYSQTDDLRWHDAPGNHDLIAARIFECANISNRHRSPHWHRRTTIMPRIDCFGIVDLERHSNERTGTTAVSALAPTSGSAYSFP